MVDLGEVPGGSGPSLSAVPSLLQTMSLKFLSSFTATSSQGSSTTTQSVETSTPNDAKNQNQIVINIDIMTSDGNQSTEGSGDIATGYPIPKVVVTSFDPKAVSCEASSSLSTLPKIAKSCSENSHEETSDEEMSDEETLSTTSSDVEVVDVETCDVSVNRSGLRRQLTAASDSDTDTSSSSSEIDVVEVETASGRKRKKGTGVDDPFLELADEGLGLVVDSLGKATVVGVLLTNYQQKINEVENNLVKIRKEKQEGEMVLNLKNARMKIVEKELALLGKEISSKKKDLKELRKKEDALCKEKTNLTKKAAHCETLKNQYEGNRKNARLK